MEGIPTQKLRPTPEELSSVCSKVKCPQENCKAFFQCTSNLNMHLIKHHKIKHAGLTAKKANTQYFCPAMACPYSEGSKKYFTKLKYLKQHFLKVHAVKEFVCNKCKKRYSTETFLTLHIKNCGKVFACICGSNYNSPEAILTHIKRKGKGHEIVKNCQEFCKVNKIISKKAESRARRERLIYPKLAGDKAFPVHYIAAIALSELSVSQNPSKVVDKGVQTDIFDFDSSRDHTGKCFKRLKNSQQTQTASGKNKKLKISTQTQTNNDYFKRKSKGHTKTTFRKRNKSMETQTKEQFKISDIKGKTYSNTKELVLSNKKEFGLYHEKKPNEKISLEEDVKPKNETAGNDEEKARTWLWEMMSSSSSKTSELDLMKCNAISLKEQSQYVAEQEIQVNQVFDLSKLCNIETQTDIEAFLSECNEDTNFTLCSTTETQTTDDFDCLLHSNMCTQTCEVDRLFNFNFVHNETQTAWPDLNDCNELDS